MSCASGAIEALWEKVKFAGMNFGCKTYSHKILTLSLMKEIPIDIYIVRKRNKDQMCQNHARAPRCYATWRSRSMCFEWATGLICHKCVETGRACSVALGPVARRLEIEQVRRIAMSYLV